MKYLIEASNFADYQFEHFWDWDANGFFFTSDPQFGWGSAYGGNEER